MGDGVKKLVGAALTIGSFFVPGGQLIRAATMLAGTSLLSSAFAPRMPRATFRNEFRVGPVQSMESPEPAFYGTVRTSGTFAFPPRVSGANSEYLWYCVVFGRKGEADVAVTSYEKLYIDGTEIDVATEIDVDGYVTHPRFLDADDNPLVRVKFYQGAAGQTADPWLTAAFPSFWTANHKLDGCAYMVARFELDTSEGGTNPDNDIPNVWEKGVPREVSVLLRGRPVYRAALDSTNGGAGTHRANDPSTWEFSDNAIDCTRDYLTDPRLGPGVPHARVDDSVTIPESAVCAESVTVWDGLGGSTTQPRWTCDGIAYADETHGAVLLNLLSACVGELSRSGGFYRLFAGHYETPSHSIDETWLAGAWRLHNRSGRNSRYNAVRGQFADPGRGYQTGDYPSLTNTTWETADGGRQFLDLRLPFTTDAQRAQRVGKVWHKRSRHLREFELVCNLRALEVEPMDTATINLPEMGLSGVVARCTNWTPDQSGVIVLSFRVEESADWTINYTTDLTEPPAFTAMDTADAVVPTASSLTAAGVPGGVALGWVNPDMTRISHVEVWGSQTNDRATATRLTRTRGEDFVHNVTGGETWYYWIVTRSDARWGPWHPVSATAGVSATALRPIPVDGYAAVDGPAAWARDQDGSTWNPTATTTDIDWTFAIAGTAVARISRRVTRSAAGLLTVSTTTHPAGDLNTGRVTISTTGGGTRAVTLVATYNHDGHTKAIAQTVTASLSGQDGQVGSANLACAGANGEASSTGYQINFCSQGQINLEALGISPGDIIGVSVEARNGVGISDTKRVRIRFWSESPGVTFIGSGTIIGLNETTNSESYTRIHMQVTVPSGAVGLDIGAYGSVTPPGVWYARRAMLYVGTQRMPYVPVPEDGADGQSIAELQVYRRASSTPATPSGGSYNFGTKVLTPPSGWSVGIPAGTDPVYMARGSAAIIGQTGTDTPSWGAPALAFQDGDDGAPGFTYAEIYCYRRASSAPGTPTGGSFNFDTNALSPPSGWSASVPAGTDPCYVSVAIAVTQGGTGTDNTLTWTAPVVAFENGQPGTDGDDGLSVAIVKCYRRASSAPSTPSGGSFNFGTLGLTPPSGWSATIPAGTETLYESQATASISGATGIDSTLSWSAPAASQGEVEENSASGTGASLLLNDHNSSGRPILVTISGTLNGTTTTASGATWELRLQRRIGAGSFIVVGKWTGKETGLLTSEGPFQWTRETEFNPDQFEVRFNSLSLIDNPGSGLIDYSLSWASQPGGAASQTYSWSIQTREG